MYKILGRVIILITFMRPGSKKETGRVDQRVKSFLTCIKGLYLMNIMIQVSVVYVYPDMLCLGVPI